MKFALAFVMALSATGVAAYAHEVNRIVIRHGGGPAMDMDGNRDGWLTRAEASAGADRMFAELDTNHDGRLTDADRPHEDDFDVELSGPEGLPAVDESNCTRTVEPAQGGHGQRVTVICNGDDDAQGGERRVIIRRGDHAAPHAENGRRVERDVTIIRRGDDEHDGIAPPAPPAAPGTPHAMVAPLPPHPPHPPMFMMLMASSDEMDTNHDGAISRDEFRAQQLRFFDASDANGDGRIRFEPPPEPPVPPTPPVAPAAPTPPPTPR